VTEPAPLHPRDSALPRRSLPWPGRGRAGLVRRQPGRPAGPPCAI